MSGIKVVFLGPQSCGKTSIINRIVYDAFEQYYTGTVGIDFSTHRRTMPGGGVVSLQIWDTAGQERFYSIIPAYIRTALGVFLVFDVSNEESFMSLRSWYQLVMHEAGSDPVIAVIANKTDLSDDRVVERETAKTFSDSINALYFEVSAKENTGLKECVGAMCEALLKKQNPCPLSDNEQNTVRLSPSEAGDADERLVCGVCY